MTQGPNFARSHIMLWLFFTLMADLASTAPPAPQERHFTEEISVVAVDIPVRVIRKGSPVLGLTANDFVVLDDGVEQTLTGFDVRDLRRPSTDVPHPGSAGERDGVAAPLASDLPAQPVGRSFVVLFDAVYSRPGLLARSIDGIRTMLTAQLHPHDRAAVAVFDGSIQMLSGLTDRRPIHEGTLDLVQAIVDGSRQGIRTAATALSHLQPTRASGRKGELQELLDHFGPRAALALAGPSHVFGAEQARGDLGASILDDGSRRVEDRRALRADFDVGGVERVVNNDPLELTRKLAEGDAISRVIRMTKQFAELVTLLGDVEGDKHLILVSEGFPPSLLLNARVTRALHAMFEAFERSGWIIQAIDLDGVPAASGNIKQAFSGPTGLPSSPEMRGFSADALFHLAEETGGWIIENENAIGRATARLIERTSVTYHLSFERSDIAADGAFRKIKVKLRDDLPRARIRHRRGYFAPKPLDQNTDIERRLADAELLLGDRERHDLDVTLLAVASPRDDHIVPLVIQVDGLDLLADLAPRAERIEVDIHVYALASDGEVRDLVIDSMRFDLADVRKRLAATGLRHVTQLTLPPGPYRLRTLVRRRGAPRAFLASQSLIVPADATTSWPQPLWLDATNSWLLTRDRALVGDPFVLGERSFVPAPAPQVTPGSSLSFVLTAPEGSPSPMSDARITGEVVDAQGTRHPGRVSLGDRSSEVGARDQLIGSIATHGLRAGNYRLTLRATDASENAVVTAENHFRIERP